MWKPDNADGEYFIGCKMMSLYRALQKPTKVTKYDDVNLYASCCVFSIPFLGFSTMKKDCIVFKDAVTVESQGVWRRHN